MTLRALGVVLMLATLGCAGLGARRDGGPHLVKVVRITGFRFVPADLTVSPGDTVIWENEDSFAHTTTADSGSWSSAELARSQRHAIVAPAPGRYPYHCAAHPGMKAVLEVRRAQPSM
ncbi:MAG: plastocyanin/azurin family copper-binding protein [Gemmatimonadota bacterium]